MRAALLLAPPMTVTQTLPSCFGDPVDDGALREWLAHPRATRHLFAAPPEARFVDLATRALGLDAGTEGKTVVVYVAGCAVLLDADLAALGLDAALEESRAAASREVNARLDAAQEAFDKGRWDEARSLSADADARMGHEPSDRHADALVTLGEIARLHGDTDEAIAALDRALAMRPAHEEALRARAAIARTTGEHAIAAAMMYRSLRTIANPEQRVDVLSSIATLSLEAAREATLHALEIRPGDAVLLGKRRAIAELAGNWDDVVTVDVQIAERIADPIVRARQLALAGRIAGERAGNAPRAVALYEAAIEDDPRAPGAFEEIERTLVAASSWDALAAAYERQIARLDAIRATDELVLLWRKLAEVALSHLDDVGRAIQALDEVVAARPSDFESRERLALLLDSIGRTELALPCLDRAAEQMPFRAQTYRELRRMLAHSDLTDRAFSTASVLVALGEADLDEQLAYTQFAPESPLVFARPFDPSVWRDLAPHDHDADVDAVARAVEPAAVAAWLDARELDEPLPLPAARYRQEPETTTVSAVRSFLWASRLLGVEEPSVYADPENARVGAVTVPARSEVVLLGRSVLTGRSSVELAFIAAHHVVYARPGWRAIAYFPTTEELQMVLRAAVALARPDLIDRSAQDEPTRAWADRLDARLGGVAREQLGAAMERIVLRGARMQLPEWRRTVETIACRAALLATGDVTVASNLLAVAGGHAQALTARDRARDLFPFAASEIHATLRRALGVAVA